MSDLWPFSLSSPPPVNHHSSLTQASPFISSPPPLSSPSSPRNHGNPPHAKVPSYHFVPQTQVSSPHHLPHPQVTSFHLNHSQLTTPHLCQVQVTSPHIVPETQVSSPHLHPSQVTSPHLVPQTHGTSPHHNQPHVTTSHLFPQAQVTSPHPPQVTSPYFVPQTQVSSLHFHQPQVSSPHLRPQDHVSSPHLLDGASPHFVLQTQVTSPHLLPPPQHHLSNQNHDPGLDHPNWSRSEPPSEFSYLLKNYSYSNQNQTTAHLDHQNQHKFSTGVTHHRDELENTHRLPYDTNSFLASGLYGQGDTPGPVQDTWRPQGPTLSQLQCSPLGSMSGEVALGRWSSMEFSSSPAEDFSGNQFFHDGCYDNNAPQPFLSPNTPGPSPHYPQTPTISSPGPQMHPREERLDFQTSRQLSRDKTLNCLLHEYDSHPTTSDPGQHHQHQTSRHLLQSQSELIQDQTVLDTTRSSESCFSPQGRGQDVGSAAQSPGLPAGLSWREECGAAGGGRRGAGGGAGAGGRAGGGAGGRGGGRGGGAGGRRGGGRGDSQLDWTWMKQLQPENSIKVPDCRLQCTVCKRDFRSLPALNGHMRSHSGSRSVTWLNKGEDTSPPVQPVVSMVMPVSVPVQSRGTAKACRGGQRRCSRPSPATGGAVLYRSLLRRDEEEAVAKGDRPVSGGGDDEEAVVEDGEAAIGGEHYTPPPMLCPLRAGPGLYCSLTTRRQQRVQTVLLHNAHNGLNDLVAVETAYPPPGTLTTGINKPRINVGRGFQAEIPPLRGRNYAHSDSHNALPLWTPWDELERPVNQQRVDDLLTMARSSVVPGGGASPESALHVLSECRGDFLLTVEKLLLPPETSNNKHNTAQQYPSVSWSAAERRLLVKSLQLHQKDFIRIQKAVQTKSLSQCVEFYYLWKKKLSLSARTPAGLTVTLPDSNVLLPETVRGEREETQSGRRGGRRDGSAGTAGGRGSSGGEEAAENLQRSLLLHPAGSIRTSDRGGGGGDKGDARGEEDQEGGEEKEEEEEVQEVQEEPQEGAGFQLALSDGGLTPHGLHVLHAPLSRVHRGDGSSPICRQQSVTGHGQAPEHGATLP